MGRFTVITAEDRNPDTAQTEGMFRTAAISHMSAGSKNIWVGCTTMEPGTTSAPHHHGDCESAIYMISGHARFRVGEKLEEVHDVGPGDFIFVPPWAVHQEINLSNSEPIEMVVVRDTQEPQAYTVDIPEEN